MDRPKMLALHLALGGGGWGGVGWGELTIPHLKTE
jgi:hypothetical protein